MTLLNSFCRNGREISAEKRLCRELMRNYTTIGRNGRPVVNMSKPVLVEFGLGLIQMDLDEKNKILSTSMWSRYVSTNYAQETVASPCLRTSNFSRELIRQNTQHNLHLPCYSNSSKGIGKLGLKKHDR